MSIIETLPVVLSSVSLVLCLIVLVMYYLYPGTRIHPNQIIIHRAFADVIFSIAYLLSIHLNHTGDPNCETFLGAFTSYLIQYSLLASELCYFFLAIDGLITVSRPFTNPKTRYTFYGLGTHAISIISGMLLLFVTPDILGRHVTGVCWIRNSKKLINFGCWEYLYIWIIIIYTSSCILLVSMANCLNQLPIYQEELLQDRARILEKMMLYVFTFIIYGLCICILYCLIEMINHHFNDWKPRFITSHILEMLFYCVASSRGCVTAYVFMDNIRPIFKSRNFFSNKDGAWNREVQPLLNTVIRRQLLNIFSCGVEKAIKASGYLDNNQMLFNKENGVYRNILTESRFYDDKNIIDIQATIKQEGENKESEVLQFVEYAPLVFSYLRYLNGVRNVDYIAELSGLSDCSYSEGASGALFVRSKNQYFIIKFVNKSEFMVLKDILKDYTEYLTRKQFEMCSDHSVTSEAELKSLDEEAEQEETASQYLHSPRSQRSNIRLVQTTNPHQTTPPSTTPNPPLAAYPSNISSQYDDLNYIYPSTIDEEIPLSSEVIEGETSLYHPNLFNQSMSFHHMNEVGYGNSSSSLRSIRTGLLRNPDSVGSFPSTRLVEPPFVSTSPRIQEPMVHQSSYADIEEGQTPLLSKVSQGSYSHVSSCNVSPNPQTGDSFTTPRSEAYTTTIPYPSSNEPGIQEYIVQADNHVVGSFLNRYYGMYSLEVFGSTVYFVVMENILPSDVNEVYDLKGSWVGREPKEPRRGQVLTCQYCKKSFQYGSSEVCDRHSLRSHKALETKKDNSFHSTITVDKQVNQQISNRLREDVEFLCNHDLMDYSILVGIRNVQMEVRNTLVFISPTYSPQIPYGTRLIEGPGIFYIGIIDYLQKYTFKKKLERFWKCFFRCADRDGISDVPPLNYRNRILERVVGNLFIDFDESAFSLDVYPDQNGYDYYYPPQDVSGIPTIPTGGVNTSGPTGPTGPMGPLRPQVSTVSSHPSINTSVPSNQNPSVSTGTSTTPIYPTIPNRSNSITTTLKSEGSRAPSSTRILSTTRIVHSQNSEYSQSSLQKNVFMSEGNIAALDVSQSPNLINQSSSSRHSSFAGRTSESLHERKPTNLSTHQESTSDTVLEAIDETGNDSDLYIQRGIV